MRVILFSTSIFFTAVVGLPANAFAHLGHVGELAGHGHWIAVGAGIALAGLGALLGNKGNNDTSTEVGDEDAVEDCTDGEFEGATS